MYLYNNNGSPLVESLLSFSLGICVYCVYTKGGAL